MMYRNIVLFGGVLWVSSLCGIFAPTNNHFSQYQMFQRVILATVDGQGARDLVSVSMHNLPNKSSLVMLFVSAELIIHASNNIHLYDVALSDFSATYVFLRDAEGYVRRIMMFWKDGVCHNIGTDILTKSFLFLDNRRPEISDKSRYDYFCVNRCIDGNRSPNIPSSDDKTQVSTLIVKGKRAIQNCINSQPWSVSQFKLFFHQLALFVHRSPLAKIYNCLRNNDGECKYAQKICSDKAYSFLFIAGEQIKSIPESQSDKSSNADTGENKRTPSLPDGWFHFVIYIGGCFIGLVLFGYGFHLFMDNNSYCNTKKT